MKSEVYILASGTGSRFDKSIKKQFFEINNTPIIAYTIWAFEQSNVNDIYITTSKEDIETIKKIVQRYKFSKVKDVVEGGSERYLSVYNTLKSTENNEVDITLIHDGARPFVTIEKINEIIESIKQGGNYILAKKAVDTIKEINSDTVITTIDRNKINLSSTPQGFYKKELIKSYKKAIKENINFTDDSSIMEMCGYEVKVIEDSNLNIKITTKEDIIFGEAIVKELNIEVPIKKERIETSSKKMTIYTDGACSGNPGAGGYGIVMMYGDKEMELKKGFEKTTNNRMELMAVVDALDKLKREMDITLYSDSKYVVDSVTKKWVYGWQKRGWKKSDGKPALNVDLWKQLLPLLEKHNVTFVWVKGHADNKYNERCDELARNAITDGNLNIDKNFV